MTSFGRPETKNAKFEAKVFNPSNCNILSKGPFRNKVILEYIVVFGNISDVQLLPITVLCCDQEDEIAFEDAEPTLSISSSTLRNFV